MCYENSRILLTFDQHSVFNLEVMERHRSDERLYISFSTYSIKENSINEKEMKCQQKNNEIESLIKAVTFNHEGYTPMI